MKELQDIDLKTLIESETGNRFNNRGYANCPFHNEKSPSMSIKFNSNTNKDKFKCWGCETSGDAIDFIMKLKGMDYKAAREYLGLENKKSVKELESEKIKDYIKWQLENREEKHGYKLIGLFTFVNAKNQVIYYKAKFIKPDGKKETPYYHIEGDKVKSTRNAEEVPYNLYNVLKGIEEGKTIIFVEGEKDVNTINSLLKGLEYVATSIKGCIDLEITKKPGMKAFVISDTGEAGENYKWKILKEFIKTCKIFKVVNLPGLKALGNNKDVTDWIETGNAKKDLLKAFDRSLDLKNKYELQQDKGGIYKTIIKVKDEEIINEIRVNLTNFRLLEATRMKLVDDDKEGIKLVMQSPTGHRIERIGSSTVFNNVKSFGDFLGTMDLTFISSKLEDLTMLKAWINQYWAIENEELYQGLKFITHEDKIHLVTEEGAISSNGINYGLKTDDSIKTGLVSQEGITKDELMELKSRIFRFSSADKTIPIIGTVINNLAVLQNQEAKDKLHIMLMVGESGSGKSTILTNVIAPILNYPLRDIKSIGLITSFALARELSNGNYSSLFDEFKPSMMDRYKVLKISENLRNLYDRTTISRGDKSFKTKEFQLTRPLIIAGEESYPNSEKALIERSCIVYLSRRERTQSHTESMEWLIENEDLLKKFGRSLIDIVLELTTEQYKEIKNNVKAKLPLKNRPLMTGSNIATGIEIFNILLERKGLKKIEGYEEHIMKNINEEILEGAAETKSTVEQMICLYNSMIEDGRAYEPKDVIIDRGDGLFIKTSEMINQICVFCNTVGSAEVIPLKARDFKKQATKSGYLIKPSAKQFKINQKGSWFDQYSKDMLRLLRVSSIVQPGIMQVEMTEDETNVIEGYFGAKTP